MIQRRFAVLFAAWVLLAPGAVRAGDDASPNDTARFLAGMQPSAGSPLAALADRGWQQHANYMDAAFDRVEQRQLSKIRRWSSAHLTNPRPTLFYMFSGPDFLYANAFFGNAGTYVLSGLEPVGAIPDVMALPRGTAPQVLANLRGSLESILGVGFFITRNMQTTLSSGRLSGTLPVLYVFLARSGKTVESAELINLDDKGEVRQGDGEKVKTGARGVKITFTDKDNRKQTLYYFSTNLADDSFRRSGFEKFCHGFGVGDGLVKSASYLLHSSEFSHVREFLLGHSAAIVQDDTGIPVTHFDGTRWKLYPYGRYIGPISIFRDRYQNRLREIYQRHGSDPIDFSFGYRWQPDESNLLLAIRTDLQSTN